MKKLVFGISLALPLLSLWCYSIDAKAGPALEKEIEYVQPDGTKLKATRHGDEYFNYVVGNKGDVYVKKEDNYWYYRTKEKNTRQLNAKVGIDTRPSNTIKEVEVLKEAPGQSKEEQKNRMVLESKNSKWDRQQNVIVFLVEFNDVKLETNEEEWSQKIFGKDGKTVRNFYKEQTLDKIDVTPAEGDLAVKDGVLKMTLDRDHPDRESEIDEKRAVISEVLHKAKTAIDYAEYDKNKNGEIEPNELHIMFVIAGYEEGSGDGDKSVWGHKGTGYLTTVNGHRFNNYTMFGEKMKRYPNDISLTIGVICHELGHDLGVPDLYNVNYEGLGIGAVSLMAHGCWGAEFNEEDGTTPVGLDAYSKIHYGVPYETVNIDEQTNRKIKTLSTGEPTILKLLTKNSNEYFLIENRQLLGFDKGLSSFHRNQPGGIGVYRINTKFGQNEGINRQLVTLLEADESIVGYSKCNNNELYSRTTPFYFQGLANKRDPQPTKIGENTKPSSKLAEGNFLGTEFTILSEPNKEMDLAIGSLIPVDKITIYPEKITLEEGASAILKPTILPNNASNQKIHWSSSIPLVVSVDNEGKITVPKGVEFIGKVMITAKTVDGEKVATCEVNVIPQKINVTGITIEPKELNLSVGETQTLKAIVSPENATNKNVVWTTSNDSIATVSNTGEVVALAKGTTEVIATTEDGQKQFTTTVYVDDKIESVQITNKREKVVLPMNKSTKTSAKVLPEKSNQSIIWESEFPEIATVDENGNVIAKSFGRTKITAKSKVDPTKSDSYIVITDDHGDFDTPTVLGLGRPVNGRYDFDEKERIDGRSFYKDEDYFIFQAPEDGTYIYYYYATHEEENETFLVPIERVSYIGSQNKWDFNKRKPVMQELKLSKGEIFMLGISGEDYTGMDDMIAVSPRMKTFVGTKYTVLIDKEENVSKGEIVIKDNKNNDVTGKLLEMKVGETVNLSGEIVNSNILNPFYFDLNWSSENKNIVEAESSTGKITAKKAGEVKIKSANQFYGGMFQHRQEVLNTQITVRVK